MPKKIGKFAESYADEAGITAKKKGGKTAHDAPLRAPAPESSPGDVDFRVRVDPHNYRIHPDRNKELIRKSLSENGAGRSIVVDKTGASIGGSGVLEQAESLGLKKRIIETDGSELVVVVRKDIAPDDPRRKQLALADNATTDQSEWDFDALKADWTADDLEGWGIDLPDDKPEGMNPYTAKTDVPQYVPTGKDVSLSDCLNSEKTESLIAEIMASGVSEDEKAFLIEAAKRHNVFNYKNVAEYYASKASPEMQALMEKSALVLIDVMDAIRDGYVVLSEELESIIEGDVEDEG